MHTMLSNEIIDYLVLVCNKRLVLRTESFNLKNCMSKPVVAADILELIAIITLCENIASVELNTFRKQFNAATAGFSVRFGQDRCSEIFHSLTPSGEEISQISALFNNFFFRNWCTESLVDVAVDETIFAYEPRMKHRLRSDPDKEQSEMKCGNPWEEFLSDHVGLAPVHHIQGKPHSDGLMLYGLATKSTHSNIPYVLSFIPHLGDKITMESIIQKFLDQFPSKQPVHFVIDARFASQSLFDNITTYSPNCFITMSMKSNIHSWIWDILLNSGTMPNHWKAVFNSNTHSLFSALKKTDRSFLLISNAFKPSSFLSTNTEIWDSTAVSHLKALPIQCLKELVQKTGLVPEESTEKLIIQLTKGSKSDSTSNSVPMEVENSVEQIEYGVGERIEALFDKTDWYCGTVVKVRTTGRIGRLVEFDDGERKWISLHGTRPCSHQKRHGQLLDDNPHKTPKITYSKKKIEAMKCIELKQVMQEVGLSVYGKKKDLQKRAIAVFCPQEAVRVDNLKMWNNLSNDGQNSDGIHHSCYREHFNAEDLENRLWYRLDKFHKPVMIWTVRFLWGIIRVAIGNAWALFNEHQDIPLAQFRRMWAEYELSHNRPDSHN